MIIPGRFGKAFAAVILIILTTGCDSRTDHRLTITGSSTIAPVMADLAAAFEAHHPRWRIDIQSGGSSRGIRDARQGLADAGMVSRALDSSETDLIAHTFAYDGIAIVVNAGNAVASLESGEIRQIYRGQLQNWAALGGPDLPIMVINKAEGRATLEVFLDYFGLDGRRIKADLIAGENQQVIQTVARNRAAIGYVSIGTAEYETENGTPIKLLPLDGKAATTANVAAGKYPMTRVLNVVTSGPPDEQLAAFMRFWHSPEAANIIRSHYFVPTTP